MTKVVEFTGDVTGRTAAKVPHVGVVEVGQTAIVSDEEAEQLLQEFTVTDAEGNEETLSDWVLVEGAEAATIIQEAEDAEAQAAEEAAAADLAQAQEGHEAIETGQQQDEAVSTAGDTE